MDNYKRALKHFQAGRWDKLGQNLYIPHNWWDTISEGICQTDEFYEVVTDSDDHSVFEKLDNQLTTLSQYTPDPAPYTGQEAVQNVRGPSFDDWNPRCTVQLPYSIAVEENEEEDDDEEDRWGIYTWGIYQKRGTAQYAIVLESTYWKTLQLYNSKNWNELANALDIANEWRVKVKKWFAKRKKFEQALEYMKEREAKSDPIYTKVREIFSPLRGIQFGDSERDDQDSRIAASIILDDQKGKDGRLKVHVWSLEVSGTDSFSDSTALEGGKLKSDGGELMYITALRFYKERHWTGLRSLFDIKRSSWNSVLQKICQSESFGEVIEKRDDPSVFEELDKQLTGRVPDPSDALYTGDKAVKKLCGPSFDNWNHRCTVRLSHDIDKDKKRAYIWGIYQKIGTTQYAIVLESTYWKTLKLYNNKKWDELANALDIANEWRDKVKEWFGKPNDFEQALIYMKKREAKGDPIYTKVREIFSPLRGIKLEHDQMDLRTIASIILDVKPKVHVWSLKGSDQDSFSESTALKDGNINPMGGKLVYSKAVEFHTKRHWAGLRNLFDIERSWWNSVLKRICQSRLFGEILKQLKEKERNGERIYPQFNNIFSWTRVPECKPEDVKVIIVGQDPLRNPNATGISFLVEGEKTKVKSITAVINSVVNNLDLPHVEHACPYSWCTQGVLLLNRIMTTGINEQHNHFNLGWERITNMILEYFVSETEDHQLYVLLWGSYWDGQIKVWERLTERITGPKTELIQNFHPNSYKFRGFQGIEIIHWETIADGYPYIPAGVIHH